MAGLLTVSALSASAAITGNLNISGTVRVSLSTIDWQNPTGAPNGVFLTIQPGTNYFASIFSTDPFTPYGGRALDLGGGPFAGPVFVPSFMSGFTAPGYSGLFFDLTLLDPSSAPVCTGSEGENQPCRIGTPSPFTLTQKFDQSGNPSVAIDFSIQGFFQDSNLANSRANYKGTYTTQLTDPALDTISEVLTRINGGGFVEASYSGNFSELSAIPEPSTVLFTLTGGLLMLGSAVLRKIRS
ncbi:MAG TPA: hypothetical protein VM120_00090 [Bryobacteraceae bacterium]|nr:hypothetical protein [Bryobacteraceae bacterium]